MIQRLRRVLSAVLLPAILAAGLGLHPYPARAAGERDRQRAEDQLERLAGHLEVLQSDPERAIPAEILRDAQGLVVVRETRAGFVLGGKGGRGALLLRQGGRWSAPVLLRAREGGLGLQAGWQNATFVHVLMTRAAVDAMRTNQFRFGVGLRVTSGPRSVGDEAKTRSPGADVLLYADTGGLFGGLSVEAGTLRPDDEANRALYGRGAEEVLYGAGTQPSAAGKRLHAALGTTDGGSRQDR